MKRTVLWLSCAAAALLPVAAEAQSKPVAVVSFAGYDALIKDLDYLGELSGTPQLSQSLEGILALVTRAQGLAGLDKSKPIGAAVSLSEAGSPVPLIFVPVTDSTKLLDALQGVIPNVEDLGDGFSKLRLPNGPPVIMKESDGWAFLSNTQDNLANLPKDPSKLLGDLPEDYDLAVQLNVQNIPEPLVQFAINQIKMGAQQGLQQKADEDDATYAARKEFTENYLNQVTTVIEEIDQLTFGLAIDEEEGGAYFDTEMTVKPEGELAKAIAAAQKGAKPSKLAGFADDEAVANLHFTTPVMENDKESILGLLQLGRTETAKKIESDDKLADLEVKAAVKGMVSDIFDVVEATVKGGQLNAGAVIYGEGPFEMIGAGLVVDAKKLEKVLKKAVELFGDAPNFPKVKFDAATSGGITYHTITAPLPDREAKKVLGEEVTIAFGFGENLVVIAVGEENPIETAAEVLKDDAGAADLPPAQLQVKLGPIVNFAVENDDDAKEPVKAIAAQLADSDDDHITITSNYMKNGSWSRVEIEEGLLKAIGKAAIAGMQRGGR